MQNMNPLPLNASFSVHTPKNKGVSYIVTACNSCQNKKLILMWYYYSDFANCLNNAFFHNKQF